MSVLTYSGTVTAATDWDGLAERKTVRPGLRGSYEELLHESGERACYLMFRDDSVASEELSDPRLERAIGVIYRPETERMSHYFHAIMPKQFDAVIHIDETARAGCRSILSVAKDQPRRREVCGHVQRARRMPPGALVDASLCSA